MKHSGQKLISLISGTCLIHGLELVQFHGKMSYFLMSYITFLEKVDYAVRNYSVIFFFFFSLCLCKFRI